MRSDKFIQQTILRVRSIGGRHVAASDRRRRPGQEGQGRNDHRPGNWITHRILHVTTQPAEDGWLVDCYIGNSLRCCSSTTITCLTKGSYIAMEQLSQEMRKCLDELFREPSFRRNDVPCRVAGGKHKDGTAVRGRRRDWLATQRRLEGPTTSNLCSRGPGSVPPGGRAASVYLPRDKAGKPKTKIHQYYIDLHPKGATVSRSFYG